MDSESDLPLGREGLLPRHTFPLGMAFRPLAELGERVDGHGQAEGEEGEEDDRDSLFVTMHGRTHPDFDEVCAVTRIVSWVLTWLVMYTGI